MKVAVAFTTCGRRDLLDEAVAAQRAIDPSILCIVADAGKEFLPPKDCDDYIHTPGTVHAVTAHKSLMAAFGKGVDYAVTSNDDCFPVGDWRPVMIPEWESVKGELPGMIGASTDYTKGPQRRSGGPLTRIPFVVPIFALTTEDAYRKAPFPLDLPTQWFSDDAVSLNMKRAGLSLWMSAYFVRHLGSQSLKANGVDLGREEFHGARYMANKYGRAWRKELEAL